MRKTLHQIGFLRKHCEQRKAMMEQTNIISWSFQILRQIKKFKEEKRNIIYLDETWIDCNLIFSKCWWDEKISALVKESAGYHFIIVHAGLKSGFVQNT